MVNPLVFAHTPKIFFGPGTIELLPREISKMGTCPLLITGRSFFINTSFWPALQQNLEASHLRWHHALVEREPSPKMIDDILEIYKDTPIDVVVAIGGGSVMDAGKAISAIRCHPKGVKAYLEGVGNEKPSGKKIPFIAIPTTAGTGSEATKNAVLSEIGAQGFKKSLRHDNYVPNVAIIDPSLALTCRAEVTAQSGMDAFTQLLESYLSSKGHALTDALALEGLTSVREGLIPAYEDGGNLDARGHMAYAALLSGITLANAGLGVVHGFASSLGGKIDIPHGALCARLMGPANRTTLARIRFTGTHPRVLKKYATVGQLFSQEEGKSDNFYAEYLVDLIEEWTERMNIPKLSSYGLDAHDVSAIAHATGQKNHPIQLTDQEMVSILSLGL